MEIGKFFLYKIMVKLLSSKLMNKTIPFKLKEIYKFQVDILELTKLEE
jgi:hypothetical protein